MHFKMISSIPRVYSLHASCKIDRALQEVVLEKQKSEVPWIGRWYLNILNAYIDEEIKFVYLEMLLKEIRWVYEEDLFTETV